MDIQDIVGLAAGSIVFISFIPQIAKSIDTKEVNDLSIGMFIMSAIAMGLYLIYGVSLGLIPVVTTTFLSLCANLLQIILILKYRCPQ